MSGHRVFELGGLSTAQYLLTSIRSRACVAVPLYLVQCTACVIYWVNLKFKLYKLCYRIYLYTKVPVHRIYRSTEVQRVRVHTWVITWTLDRFPIFRVPAVRFYTEIK